MVLKGGFSKIVLQGDGELASVTAKCWEENSADGGSCLSFFTKWELSAAATRHSC